MKAEFRTIDIDMFSSVDKDKNNILIRETNNQRNINLEEGFQNQMIIGNRMTLLNSRRSSVSREQKKK
jgi:hypothetical protein